MSGHFCAEHLTTVTRPICVKAKKHEVWTHEKRVEKEQRVDFLHNGQFTFIQHRRARLTVSE
jgi:hypothetical protein